MSESIAVADAIPEELRARPQWVCWRYEDRDGKPTKPPFQTDGSRADSTDPGTWTTYENAFAARGDFDGIGSVFSGDDPHVGIDLDDCFIDGQPKPAAAAVLLALDSYSEISPSGNGVKVWVRADLNLTGLNLNGKWGKRTNKAPWGGKAEVYAAGRFFTVTGNHLDGTPAGIEDRQEQLGEVLAELFPNHTSPLTENPRVDGAGFSGDDAELLERMFAASNGRDIRALWEGQRNGHGSDSERDLALCSHLRVLHRRRRRAHGLDVPTVRVHAREVGSRRLPPGDDQEGHQRVPRLHEPRPNRTRMSDLPEPEARTLREVVDTFGRWLHLPDPGALLAVLGTIAANRLDGDPVWLLLVGPPGRRQDRAAALPSRRSQTCTRPATLTEAGAAVRHAEARTRPTTRRAGCCARDRRRSGSSCAKDFGTVLSHAP